MPPYQILVLSSGVGPWWSLLQHIHCLWRHNMTSYSRLYTNVLAKFVDTTYISRDTGAAVRQWEQQKCWGQWKLIKNKKIVANYQADKLHLLAIFIISRRFVHLLKWASSGQCFLTTYNTQLTNNKKQWAVWRTKTKNAKLTTTL